MRKRPQLGPTGKFPDGSLGAHDKGELQFGVSRDSEGRIHIAFGTKVSWLTLSPETAIELARILLRHSGAKQVEIRFE